MQTETRHGRRWGWVSHISYREGGCVRWVADYRQKREGVCVSDDPVEQQGYSGTVYINIYIVLIL